MEQGMHDAGQERALPREASEHAPDSIDLIAEGYLADAGGDARRALRRAVEDGVEAAGLRPGAAFNIGTISVSKTSASGSGRRRPRTPFFIDGRRGSRARRWPVAVLNDALAAATASVSV